MELARSIEVNGIRFELKDNGVQIFYTTKSGKVVYDIMQNHGASIWWIMAHKNGATLTLNRPGTSGSLRPEAPYNQPGVLYASDGHLQPVGYWLDRVSRYIQEGNNPFQALNFKEG